jgi:hypothetical protein
VVEGQGAGVGKTVTGEGREGAQLEVLGRRDFQVKLRGFRIENTFYIENIFYIGDTFYIENTFYIYAQVKLRGFRIEVEEVETVLLSSGFVRATAVTVSGTLVERQTRPSFPPKDN